MNKKKRRPVKSGKYEVINQYTGEGWVYSDIVKDHFFNPRNILISEPDDGDYDAVGEVGSPACGDTMRMWVRINKKSDKVRSLKWKTFGCGSAIAATSMFSVMLTEKGGMKIDKAIKVSPKDIMQRLGGLPNRKIHCSVLADKAFLKTMNNYFRNTGNYERIIIEGSRVIDTKLNITDKDIEEAVLEGATTLQDVQKYLKVGIGSPKLTSEIEELIDKYKKQYYGS